jgi:hypothetical protein
LAKYYLFKNLLAEKNLKYETPGNKKISGKGKLMDPMEYPTSLTYIEKPEESITRNLISNTLIPS